jgi:small subunit ribosomal protein S8
VPYSNLKFEIVNVLLREGYIKSFSVKGKKVKKHLEVELSYRDDRMPRIEEAKRISKPSRRVYIKSGEIRPVMQGEGMAVLSTPKGIMTGKEAYKAKMGGEMLFTIW